ncbi:MAG: arginase family protein [Promethearchaeota archaeon]
MNPFSFYDAPVGDSQTPTRFAIFGIPWDANSTHSHGCPRAAPYKLRELSTFLGRATESGKDISLFPMHDFGDVKVMPSLPDDTRNEIRQFVQEMLPWNICDPIPVMIGGDHYCSYPVIKALHDLFESKNKPPFGVIIFDAHLDYYDKWLDRETDSHCTITKRVSDLSRVTAERLIVLGVRDMDMPELQMAKSDGLHYIPAYKLQTMDQITQIIKETAETFHNRGIHDIYISIDIDVLDGAQAPGTGYTIPGGMSYRQLWNGLQQLTKEFNIIGADLVEIAPDLDLPSNLTQITALKLITELMGFITETK